MTDESKQFSIKSKIWIEDAKGGLVFGAGRMRILDAIERQGSILAAAKELRMSYRAVWGKIKVTEDRLGFPLLTRQVGGSRGGGSELTPAGKELLKRYRHLQKLIQEAADQIFEDFAAPEFVNKSE